MDTAQKVARLREIAEMIDTAAKGLAEITGDDVRELAWQAVRIRDRADSIERRAKPIAIGDTIAVRSPRGYRMVTVKKVAPVLVTVTGVGSPHGREARYRREELHPDDLARIDACFPRKVKP
jgi:hypothetical protein